MRNWHKFRNVPKWQNVDELIEFSSLRPDGFHVDHIIPLNGLNVCGLSVIENLQIISKENNVAKKNNTPYVSLRAAVCPVGFSTYDFFMHQSADYCYNTLLRSYKMIANWSDGERYYSPAVKKRYQDKYNKCSSLLKIADDKFFKEVKHG